MNGHNKYIGVSNNRKYVQSRGIGLIRDCKVPISNNKIRKIFSPNHYRTTDEELNSDDPLNDKILETRVAKQKQIENYNRQDKIFNDGKDQIKPLLCGYNSDDDYISIENESIKFIETRSNLYSEKYIIMI